MTYTEEDPEINILFRLIRHADKNRHFDRDFVDEVYEFYLDKDYITNGQMAILSKMYHENDLDMIYDEND